MPKVGHDKRLNYYQQTADEAIAELRSHRYGLTNPEAKRRLEQNGGNLLPYSVPHSPLHDVFNQATAWPVALLLIGVGLSLWQQNDKLTLSFLVLAGVVTFVGAWREHHVGSLLHNLDTLLPRKVTVHRNDVDIVIDAQHIVVGDLIVLSAGTTLVADVRLVEADQLIVDDSVLHGGHAHSHKFTHALTGNAPLGMRHNMSYAGTSVISGAGLGIVVATGAQTEIGKLLSLTQATNKKLSWIQTRLTRQSGRVAVIATALALATVVMAQAYDWSLQFSQTTLLTLLIGLMPIGLLLSLSIIFATSSNRAKRSGVRFQAPSSIDRLGKINIALLDDLDFIVEAQPTVRQILIGKQTYDVTGEGYSPEGSILGRTKKPLGKKSASDLQLFFEAAVLCSGAKLLPPDGDNPLWHGVGSSDNQLLVALAARGGYAEAAVRADHQRLQHFPYDPHRKLSSTLYEYDHRQFAFVHGDATAVIAATKHLWDAGHTRKVSVADQARFQDYIDSQAATGNHVIALAYRKFTAKQQVTQLDMSAIEQDLTLLGLVTIGRPVAYEAAQATHVLQTDGVACSLLTTRPPEIARATAAQIGLSTTAMLDTAALSQLADSQLLELVSSGAIFSHLTSEDRLRLVDVTQRSGLHTLITGRSLSDVPAMHHARVSLATSQASANVQDEADIVLLDGSLHSLTRILNRSRHTITNAGNVLQGAFTDNLAIVLLASIGAGLFAWRHIPLALTPLMALALIALLQPLPASALDTDSLDTRPSTTSLDSRPSQVFLALIAALLALGGFLVFFVRQDLSPNYIDSTSSLYLQASTVVLASLALFQWINLLFIRANHTSSLTSSKLWQNRNIFWTLGISILILGNLIYNPLLQDFFGTKALSIADWFIVASLATLYSAIRWFVRTERRHSRRAIVELHQQVHGKNAEPKI